MMRDQQARVVRDVTQFRCVTCGDMAELVLQRGDRVDHCCSWATASTWWIHRTVEKR